MTKFVLILLFIAILAIVLLINLQTLRQERSLKLWAVFSVLYLTGGLISMLDMLGVQFPNLFRQYAPTLIPISGWLMMR